MVMTLLLTSASLTGQETNDDKTVYDFSVVNQKQKRVSLDQYKGKVLLIVNTASHCGFTPQYEALQQLYDEWHDKGLEILDFPCNQFGEQAPESDADYNEFITRNYHITFPQFHKIEVNGAKEIPLYTWLKAHSSFTGFDPTHRLSPTLDRMLRKADPKYTTTPSIKWNFTKFLVDRHGKVVGRFEATANPDLMLQAIEKCIEEEI